jgi:hypothetical protein
MHNNSFGSISSNYYNAIEVCEEKNKEDDIITDLIKKLINI